MRLLDAQDGLDNRRGRGERAPARGPAGDRAGSRRRPLALCRRGHPRHRHLPRRQAAFRHEQLRRRPRRRAGRHRAGAPAPRAGASACAAEDGHAASPRRPHDRLGRAGAAGVGRRRLDDVADERGPRSAPALLRDHPDQRPHARDHPRAISTARRSSPARSAASGRVIARRSRTRSIASPTATATRSSSSPRDLTIPPSIRTAFRPLCPRTCSWRWSARCRGSSRREILQPGYAVEYDHVDPRILEPTPRRARCRGALSRRADQRHHRL